MIETRCGAGEKNAEGIPSALSLATAAADTSSSLGRLNSDDIPSSHASASEGGGEYAGGGIACSTSFPHAYACRCAWGWGGEKAGGRSSSMMMLLSPASGMASLATWT